MPTNTELIQQLMSRVAALETAFANLPTIPEMPEFEAVSSVFIVGRYIIPDAQICYCQKVIGVGDEVELRIAMLNGHTINLRGEHISVFLDQYAPGSDFLTRVEPLGEYETAKLLRSQAF